MITEISHTLNATLNFVQSSVADLTDRQMVEQPDGIHHHGTWTLGHLIYSCQGMAIELGVEPWLPEDWEKDFGYGSKPISDLQRYPRKKELLTLLTDSKDHLHHALLALGESDISRSLPDNEFPTMGHLLLQVVVAHTAYHAGQLTLWRRAIGKKSVGVFV